MINGRFRSSPHRRKLTFVATFNASILATSLHQHQRHRESGQLMEPILQQSELVRLIILDDQWKSSRQWKGQQYSIIATTAASMQRVIRAVSLLLCVSSRFYQSYSHLMLSFSIHMQFICFMLRSMLSLFCHDFTCKPTLRPDLRAIE